MNKKQIEKVNGGSGMPRLRLIVIDGAAIGVREREPTSKQYGGISAALDTLLTRESGLARDPGSRAFSSDSDEARRLLKIGGRLRELAERCLDPAAPALERLGRTVELSGRRRLLAVVPNLPRPSGAA